MDLLLLVLVGGFFANKQKFENVRACDEKLAFIPIVLCSYIAWFVVRNVIILSVACCTKKADIVALVSKLVCAFLDYFLLSAALIWCTIAYFSENAQECYNQPWAESVQEMDFEMRNWISMSGFLLLAGWLYGIVIICICTIVIPLFCALFFTLLCKS